MSLRSLLESQVRRSGHVIDEASYPSVRSGEGVVTVDINGKVYNVPVGIGNEESIEAMLCELPEEEVLSWVKRKLDSGVDGTSDELDDESEMVAVRGDKKYLSRGGRYYRYVNGEREEITGEEYKQELGLGRSPSSSHFLVPPTVKAQNKMSARLRINGHDYSVQIPGMTAKEIADTFAEKGKYNKGRGIAWLKRAVDDNGGKITEVGGDPTKSDIKKLLVRSMFRESELDNCCTSRLTDSTLGGNDLRKSLSKINEGTHTISAYEREDGKITVYIDNNEYVVEVPAGKEEESIADINSVANDESGVDYVMEKYNPTLVREG